MRLPIAYLVVSLAAVGCASIEVHSVGTGGAASVFELRGDKIEQLQAEAQRLCPRGHDVLRQWHRYQAGGSDSAALQWLGGTTNRLSGREENLALMTVQCRA
jgi:hypothetical protein